MYIDMETIGRIVGAILGFLIPTAIIFVLALIPGSFVTIPLFIGLHGISQLIKAENESNGKSLSEQKDKEKVR